MLLNLFLDTTGIYLGAIFLLVIVGLPLIGVFVLIIRHKKSVIENANRLEGRKEQLLAKFGNQKIVDRIFEHDIQVGDTKEFVIEAFGRPISVDTEVLKTKTKEVWKYKKGNETRSNQHHFQIKFDDNRVVGWDHKN